MMYRAEMNARQFPSATEHARRAVELYRRLGDRHGEAEAVHRLGLIELQRRNLGAARLLFEESRELDVAGGESPAASDRSSRVSTSGTSPSWSCSRRTWTRPSLTCSDRWISGAKAAR
jgi:hypothetical protein